MTWLFTLTTDEGKEVHIKFNGTMPVGSTPEFDSFIDRLDKKGFDLDPYLIAHAFYHFTRDRKMHGRKLLKDDKLLTEFASHHLSCLKR